MGNPAWGAGYHAGKEAGRAAGLAAGRTEGAIAGATVALLFAGGALVVQKLKERGIPSLESAQLPPPSAEELTRRAPENAEFGSDESDANEL